MQDAGKNNTQDRANPGQGTPRHRQHPDFWEGGAGIPPLHGTSAFQVPPPSLSLSRQGRRGRHLAKEPPREAPAPSLIPDPARKDGKTGWKNAAPGPGRLGEGKCCPGFGPVQRRLFHYSIRDGGKGGLGGHPKKPLWGHPGGSRTAPPRPRGHTEVAWQVAVPGGAQGGSPPPPLPRPAGTEPPPRCQPGSARPKANRSGYRTGAGLGDNGDTLGTRRGGSPPRSGQAQQPGGCKRIVYFGNK